MENIVQKFDTTLNTILQDYIKKPTLIRGVIHLLLMLYLARIAPTPPKALLVLFDNVYFKLFVFSLVLWTAQFSPSTSILIALAFMVTINYTTTGKIWEMMENSMSTSGTSGTSSVSTNSGVTMEQSIEAVKILGNTSISELATPASIILPIANIAVVSTTSQSGADAVKALAEQSMVAESGTKENVILAVSTAIDSMAIPNVQSNINVNPVEAIKALSVAAANPKAVTSDQILPIATAALSVMTTQKGVDAVKMLAQQAVIPEAGNQVKVSMATKAALDSMPTPSQAIQVLKVAAASPNADSQEQIIPLAKIALSAVTTPEGIAAIKELAQQAVIPEAGNQDKVDTAAKVAMESIPTIAAAQTASCYPVRNYDMSTVQGQQDGKMTFEDYLPFVPTL